MLIIKIESSGGFAGISTSHEIDTKKLPPSFERRARELLNTTKYPISKPPKMPKGAADCLNYKITILNGEKKRVIEYNELQMSSEMKSLINYVLKIPRN